MFGMKDKKKMDLDSLDELIAKCEDSMISPFKKKKADVVAVEVKPEEGAEAEEGGEAEPTDKPDMSDMDLEDLLRMYQEMKESKGE